MPVSPDSVPDTRWADGDLHGLHGLRRTETNDELHYGR